MLAKVRNAADDESLLQCPKLPEILALWQNLAGNAEPATWVNKVVCDDRNLAMLLEKFMQKDFSHSMIQVDGDSRYRLNPKVLTPFLDPGTILDRTRTLTTSEWLGHRSKMRSANSSWTTNPKATRFSVELASMPASEPRAGFTRPVAGAEALIAYCIQRWHRLSSLGRFMQACS